MYQYVNINIGLAVLETLKERGSSIAWLARQVGCERSNLRKHLLNNHIYPELLYKISIVLETDFFIFYSEKIRENIKKEMR